MTALQVVYMVTVLCALVAGILVIVRLRIGPTTLDRTIALDTATAVTIAIITIMVVWWRRADLGVLLIITSITGFVTAVVVSRFAGRESAVSRRILTREEAREQIKQREAEAAAAEKAEADEAIEEAAATGETDAGGIEGEDTPVAEPPHAEDSASAGGDTGGKGNGSSGVDEASARLSADEFPPMKDGGHA